MAAPTPDARPNAVSADDLRRALDQNLLTNLRPIVIGLIGLFALLAVVNPLAAQGAALRWAAAPTFMFFWELGILVCYGLVLLLHRQDRISLRRAHVTAFAIACLPLTDTLLHTWFKADPLETLGSAVLLFGVAFFFTSRRWFAAFLALALVAWAGVALLALPRALLPSLAVIVAEAAVLAVVMFAVRWRAQRRLATLHLLAERRGELLDRQNQRLKELDTLKSEFVSAVSHDLRTPLTSIIGYSEFLEDEIGGPLTQTQHDYVRQVMHAAARLEYLVDDLLDFARLEAGTFHLRLAQAAAGEKALEIAESLRPMVRERGLTLTIAADEPDTTVWMDARRVGQVLTNLLTNAIKFTPAGGRIVVRVHAAGDHVRVEVEDSGSGIAPEHQAKLFKRFSQLSAGREKGGTGLGLSISKAIVEAHGGAIGVRSELGLGSVFWFTLPVQAEPAEAAPAPDDLRVPCPSTTCTP